MTQWGLDTLFNPAKRHMDDEKRRLLSTREEAGDSSGGKRIDLASGKVVIRRDDGSESGPEAEDRDSSDGAAPKNDDAKRTRTGKTAKAATKQEPSAAAIRAAKRRGRSV